MDVMMGLQHYGHDILKTFARPLAAPTAVRVLEPAVTLINSYIHSFKRTSGYILDKAINNKSRNSPIVVNATVIIAFVRRVYVDWINLAQNRDRLTGCCDHGNEP